MSWLVAKEEQFEAWWAKKLVAWYFVRAAVTQIFRGGR